jgi:hypothetical protein
MQVDGSQGQENLLTIEVNVRNRQITQARKRYNAPSTPADQRILHAWMTTTKLSLGKFALSRAI